MSDHPEELLADYAEGSLGADEHAYVEEHLAGCDRCREELELATEARGVLRSLPDLDAPSGIPLAVRRRARGGTASRTLRVAGIAAAASIVAAGAIFGLTRLDLGGEPTGEARSEAPMEESGAPGSDQDKARAADAESAPEVSAGLAAAPSLPTYEETQRDYDPDDLAPLARRLRAEAHEALGRGTERTATRFFENFDPAAFTVPVRQAIRCVLVEVPPTQLIVPFRIEAATFEGAPAYIAAFLQGPTPDDPYDRIALWVVDRETCSLLSFASQVL